MDLSSCIESYTLEKWVLDTMTLGHLVCFIISVHIQVLKFAKSSTQEKDAVTVFYNYEVQLILEPQEFELCESTYTWIVFQ